MEKRYSIHVKNYTCQNCGKLTRETGTGESDLGLCRHCVEVMEWVNHLVDGGDATKVPAAIRKDVIRAMAVN